MAKNQRYIPGLDGLRAFAVLSVIAYHFSFSWARGGFLGVDIFFVLSGYLITSIILPAQGNQIELNLRDFWISRVRRLLPAAYVMIITTFVWVVLFNRELLNTIRGDAISSIFYTSNWWFIFHKLSYFDSFGSPSPLKNLWSLAIEEQFYIVWPIVLIMGFYFLKKRSKFSFIVLIGVLVSAITMALLYEPGKDPSRVYYGTDTRSFELLTGCLLALVWPMKRLSSKNLSTKLGNLLNVTSFITFGILILSVLTLNEYQSFLYRGGMLLVGLNTAILIGCICHPSSFLGNLLSWKPLRWIGTRSYGIYLWHYPVIVLSTPVHEIGNPVYWHVGLQLVFILIIAELSYRFIEMPIRKQGFRLFFKQYLYINFRNWRTVPYMKKTTTILSMLVLLIFTAGITGFAESKDQKNDKETPTEIKISNDEELPSSQNGDHLSKHKKEKKVTENIALEKDEKTGQDEKAAKDEKHILNNNVEEQPKHEVRPKTEQNKEKQKVKKETSENEKKANSNSSSAYKNGEGMLAIGDSVMLDIASSLHKRYPNITIDAKIGRQVFQAAQLAPAYANFNRPNNIVIIELGTNGYFANAQLDSLLGSFSKAQIFLVNTRVPRPWESNVNRALANKAYENKHITLVDWHSIAINHPEYFSPDGVHLVPIGIEALTSLIQRTITNQLSLK
ncbi:acyltransferase family protein [Heyndrickxia sp. NPDC080065]|uniref:acyltransferase family protein n=1 Tax=Heyndrickxia sp. NPDC080065 TaxID=3390568 RepID=UPI003CFE2493